MKGAIKYFLIWLFLTVAGFAVFFAIGFTVLEMTGQSIDLDNVENMIYHPWVFPVAMLGVDLIILLVFWKRRYTRNWIEYGYTYGEGFSSRKLALWAVVGAIGCLMLDVMVQEYVPIPDEPGLEKFFEVLFGNPLGILSVCLIGPLVEEAVFRGAIERRLLEKNWNPWFAIVISALLFAAAHGNYQQGVTAFIIGCFMGWVYYRTRSIWPTFLMHALNNSTAVVAAYSIPESLVDVSAETMGVPLSVGIPLIVASLILIYIAARGIGKLTHDRTRIPEPVDIEQPWPLNDDSLAANLSVGSPIPTNGADMDVPAANQDTVTPPDYNPQDS